MITHDNIQQDEHLEVVEHIVEFTRLSHLETYGFVTECLYRAIQANQSSGKLKK